MPNTGTVTQVIGPVVDVSFNSENTTLPEILNALTIEKEDVIDKENEVPQFIEKKIKSA